MLFPNIGYFNTKNEAISDTSKKSPNITYIAEQENVDRGLLYSDFGDNMPIKFQMDDYGNVISIINELIMPLTFIGKDSQNSVQLKWNNLGYSAPVINMEVSVNDGEWRSYSIDNGTGEVIALSANDTVKFRGNNETLGNVPPGPGGYWQFIMTGIIEAHGNIMSLLDKSCERLDVPEAAFIYMFAGCTSLISAPILPATTLAYGCYINMFYGCTSLTSAPELPATVLANSCYQGMFTGCTSLTELTVYADDITATDCVVGWLTDTASDTIGTLHSLGSADFTGNVPSNWVISNT